MVLMAVVPFNASSGVVPNNLYIIDLRDTPTSNGNPVSRKSSILLSNS